MDKIPNWRLRVQTTNAFPPQLNAEIGALADEALAFAAGRVADHVTVVRGCLQLMAAAPEKTEHMNLLRKSLCGLADVVEEAGGAELAERLDLVIRRLQ